MEKDRLIRICGMLILALFSVDLPAQERNDAIKAFNEGVTTMKDNPAGAIVSFENCIRIAEEVGDSADDIRQKAISVLPGLYYQQAYNLLLVEKKVPESLIAAKKSLDVAEKYNSTTVKENTQKLMIQAYTSMASSYFSKNDFPNALLAFDSVLMINPSHLTSLYNKALIYNRQGNTPEFTKSIDLYLEKLKDAGDTTRIGQANKIAIDYFRAAASKANQANDLENALTMLTTASKYGNDKDVYYYFAAVYNKQKKYSEALENARLGLAMETGSAENKAKFYYEMAVAQVGRGETNNACESFKNAMYGPFLEASKAQRTNMKCP